MKKIKNESVSPQPIKKIDINSFEYLTKSEINDIYLSDNPNNMKPTNPKKKDQSIDDYIKKNKKNYDILEDNEKFNIDLQKNQIYKTKNGEIIEIIKKLGGGSGGNVFEIILNNQRYAMKISSLNPFRLNEIQVLNLNSNFFIGFEYYEFLRKSEKVLIIMQLGISDMFNYTQNNKLSIDQRKTLIIQFFRSVENYYDHGYIHCDIKLENMLALNGNKTVLADFGSSTTKFIPSNLHQTRHMAPPEMITGREYGNLKVNAKNFIKTKPQLTWFHILKYLYQDKSSDKAAVWSIGMTMFYMLTGVYLVGQNQTAENLVNLIFVYLNYGKSIDYLENIQGFRQSLFYDKFIDDIYIVIKKCLIIDVTQRMSMKEFIGDMEIICTNFLGSNVNNQHPSFQQIKISDHTFKDNNEVLKKCCNLLSGFIFKFNGSLNKDNIDRFANILISMVAVVIQKFTKKLSRYSDVLFNDFFIKRLTLSCMILIQDEYHVEILNYNDMVDNFNDLFGSRYESYELSDILSMNIFIFEIMDTKVVFKNGGTNELVDFSFSKLVYEKNEYDLFFDQIRSYTQ